MQISDKNNFWKAWDYTRQELTYHANLGKTTRNCKNSNNQSKSSPNEEVHTTPYTWFFLQIGWLNPADQVEELNSKLDMIGCTVPTIAGRKIEDFTIAQQIALKSLKKEAKSDWFLDANIHTEYVGEATMFKISRMVGHYYYPDCKANIDALKAEMALEWKI